MTEQERLKEAYRLWWEYLKRSQDYKEYCTFRRKQLIDRSTPVPTKFQNKKLIISPKEEFNYNYFGDVHATEFDGFWKSIKEGELFKTIKRYPNGVADYSKYIYTDFGQCLYNFYVEYDREPTIKEFVEHFIYLMKNDGLTWRSTLLMLSVADETTDDLVKQFKKFVYAERKKPHIKKKHMDRRKNRWPSANYIRLDEVRRYLEVDDLKAKGMKLKDIISTLNPKVDNKDIDVQRAYNMDLQKARKILKNVEQGYFPGDY